MVYDEAYNRLSFQKPIPFSEIASYHDRFHVPYPLGVFVDAMRALEIDALNDRANQ